MTAFIAIILIMHMVITVLDSLMEAAIYLVSSRKWKK